MLSKRFSIFTILLALLLTFGHNAYSQGVSEDEIILGMHTDISGPVSSFGKYSVEGVQMRIDEINKQEVFMEECLKSLQKIINTKFLARSRQQISF